jgi:hypothetical protein
VDLFTSIVIDFKTSSGEKFRVINKIYLLLVGVLNIIVLNIAFSVNSVVMVMSLKAGITISIFIIVLGVLATLLCSKYLLGGGKPCINVIPVPAAYLSVGVLAVSLLLLVVGYQIAPLFLGLIILMILTIPFIVSNR